MKKRAKAATQIIGLVVEGPDDARTVQQIYDDVLGLEKIKWVGTTMESPYLTWNNIVVEARERRIPPRHGHFHDGPGVEDARMAVLALRCFISRNDPANAVVLVRDSDGKEMERRKGLEQARNDASWPFGVLIGVAHPMRNAGC